MKKAIMFIAMLVPMFSLVSFGAYSQVWAGSLHPVSWSSNQSSYRCSSVGGNAILNYYFTDAGKYDELNSAAHNSSCSAQNGSQLYAQAWSKDGSGQVVNGYHVGYSATSYANQGAAKGTDYAYMKVYKK